MIFKKDTQETQRFLEDTSALRDGFTKGVYIPETYEEVIDLMHECAKSKSTITLSGNGTGTTGGRIPYGDYVLSSQAFNKILSIQKFSDGTGLATVQCGVLLKDLQETTEAEGLLYPPDPTERLCFIGATIANNSSGARTFKYGPTRDYVDRITVVLSTGDLLDIKRGEIFADEHDEFQLKLPSGKTLHFKRPNYTIPQTRKHMAGYYTKPGMDLIDLFIGSEGTLGFILEADLKLIPKPKQFFGVLVYFPTPEDVIAFVDEARERSVSGTTPTALSARALEYFDKNSLDFLRQRYPNIPENAAGAVFLEQETTPETEDELLSDWFELMEHHHAMTDDSWAALTPDEQQDLREFRHTLPVLVNEWLNTQETRKISTDMAVPIPRFHELMNLYNAECQAHDFPYILFGHIGDGHLHLNILPRSMEEFNDAKILYNEFVKKSLDMGGTLSAEHGVGKLKAHFLAEMYGEEGINEMLRIKKTLDPDLMLNCGNLIPKTYLEKIH